MSSRGVPQIHRASLRDHATQERIERVWQRLDHDGMQAATPQLPRDSRMWVAALVAATFAFGAGLLIGKLASHVPASAQAPLVVAATEEQALVEVLAAGTQERSFQLPGGGQILLTPGATVELVRQPGNGFSLRLVQGEAEVRTMDSPRDRAVSIVAGEALLSTASGSAVRVRRDADNLDVAVTDGSVQLSAPSGSRSLVGGEHLEAVSILARVSPVHSASIVRPAPIAIAASPQGPALNEPLQNQAAAASDWRARALAGDGVEALALLRRQPGGVDGAIGAAKSGQELMEISDVARSGGDSSAAMRALARIVESFGNDPYAQIAAFNLGTMYKAAGQLDRSRAYFERAQSRGGALAEDALCNQIRSAANKEDAMRMAREYLDKYPDGRCKEDADRVVGGDFTPPEGSLPPTDAASSDAQPH